MKSIGKYQVIEELGGSATGRTFRARDAFRNREFAVKILQTVPGLTAEAKEQFCEHLASCAELTHRHIAKVFDLGEVEEGIFVATEWRSGMDLRHFMQENKDLPLGQKMAVMAQVAEGLAFAHSRGIAHGNLKPSNIFVDAARDISILDFGVAKWLVALLDAGARPEGLVVNYLAPEQILGQPFSARTDIFALGLMLYEFAAGKYPFSADASLLPREIVHSEPEPLRSLDPHIPEDLEKLVAHALNKDPEQRMQTAEEFASGLYLAAQQLRRVTAPPVTADHPSVEPPSVDQMFSQLQPALTPERPVTPQTASEPPVAGAPPRERPQDAEPEARPWTARSYAATRPLPPVTSPEPPKQPVAPPAAYYPPEPPSTLAFQPPKSFLQPMEPLLPPPPPQRASKTAKRLVTALVGLVLAAGIVGSLVSRQNLHASQNKVHATAAPAVAEPVAPVEKPPSPVAVAPPQPKAPKADDSGPDDLGNPEFSAKQTLNGPVRSYWESGRYALALNLVNQVLANDPANEEARTWKKKIREAQAAEAALK